MLPEQLRPSGEDVATGKAEREAAAARIRQIAEEDRLRNAQRLADHGELTLSSAEATFRETQGVEDVEAQWEQVHPLPNP